MAGSDVRVNMSVATGAAEKNIRSVRGLLQGLGRDAKASILTGVGMGAGITAFNLFGSAVGAATGFLSEAIVAARGEEESIAKLNAALNANIAGWDGNTAAIEDVLKARMKLGFSDDEQRESLALLVAATGDVNEALDIQRTAMDLARLENVDLVTASEQLIKVDSGLLRLLRSLGIEVDENTTSTEALAAVQAVAAGQAEAWGATTSGALTQMQIEFDELKEEIGKEFLPILVELARFVVDELLPAIRDFMTAMKSVDWQAVKAGIEAVLIPFRALAAVLDTIAKLLQAVTQGLGSVANANPFSGGGSSGEFGPAPSGGSPPASGKGSGGVPKYAQGTSFVPNTGPAMLHAGEMVIPTGIAAEMRGGGMGGGEIHYHSHLNVQGAIGVTDEKALLAILQRLGYLLVGQHANGG